VSDLDAHDEAAVAVACDEAASPELPDEAEAPAASDTPSPEDLQKWLLTARAADVLALLREPELTLLAMAAFAGFRKNPIGLSQPLVRKRLARDGVHIPIFVERLRALADQSPSSTAISPAPTLPAAEPEGEPQKLQTELGKERDRRRRDREQSRDQIQSLQSENAALRKELAEASTSLRANIEQNELLTRQLNERIHQMDRLQRRAARTQVERNALIAGIGSAKTNAPQPHQQPAPERTFKTDPAPWYDAVSRLVTLDHPNAALRIASDVLRAAPQDLNALKLTVEAQEARADQDGATHAARALADAALAQGALPLAMDAVTRLLINAPESRHLKSIAQPLSAALKTATPDDQAEAAAHIRRLRVAHAEAYKKLHEAIKRYVGAETLNVIFPDRKMGGVDSPLPLPQHTPDYAPISAKEAIAAVDVNDVNIVTATRHALARLKGLDTKLYEHCVALLEQCADGDASYLPPLLKEPRGAAVLDASNAAWFDQEYLVDGRARLRHIIELRRLLRSRGYFPVVIFGDAPLPYTIDQPVELRAMVDREEIALVDSGIDADEVLIREAKRLSATLVTNDYMLDWDPEGKIPKIRFGIPPTGSAYLLG